MPRLIAFLRAINVGGHTVSMAQLRKEFEALGLQNVETFIASGNVIFTSRSRDLAALEKKIESRLRASLGYEVATFLRTDAEVAELAAYRPFDAAKIASARADQNGVAKAVTRRIARSTASEEVTRSRPARAFGKICRGPCRSG